MAQAPDQTQQAAASVAIITGGLGGIGRAMARRLLADGITRLVSWDRQAVATDDDYDLALACDVTDEASVAAARDAVLEAYGRIDILVTSAGITGPVAMVAEYEKEQWARVIDINLTGTFLCVRAVLDTMVAQNYGRIVTISSIAGKEGNARQAAYSASKAAVMALTKSLGKELAHTGIRVNSVSPGFTATDLMHQMTEAQIADVLSRIPMGRAGRPEEIAELVAWLASPACSFSTGAIFDASGGRATY